MRPLSLAPLLFSGALGDADELGMYYREFSARYPDHACVIFKRPPLYRKELIRDSVYPSTYVYQRIRTTWRSIGVAVCIEKSAHGSYIERRGDGGSDNWIFNAVDFRRDGIRLTVV